eukprot:6936958-Pyramimonas_sp.AAC.1
MGPPKVGTPMCAFVYCYLALGLSRHCAIAWRSTAWVPQKWGPQCHSMTYHSMGLVSAVLCTRSGRERAVKYMMFGLMLGSGAIVCS